MSIRCRSRSRPHRHLFTLSLSSLKQNIESSGCILSELTQATTRASKPVHTALVTRQGVVVWLDCLTASIRAWQRAFNYGTETVRRRNLIFADVVTTWFLRLIWSENDKYSLKGTSEATRARCLNSLSSFYKLHCGATSCS